MKTPSFIEALLLLLRHGLALMAHLTALPEPLVHTSDGIEAAWRCQARCDPARWTLGPHSPAWRPRLD